MIYGSVCSGIEAATCAWHGLGWKPAFFSEIEAFPRAVLAHHYPDVPLHGDFTTIQRGQYAAIDLLVGGTPCQSFSVAGLRAGLDDPRGNLMLEFGALARRLGPKWLVWENVPGVLSSNGGRDFGTFLGMLGELGYGFAYRVLDAQFFGVAQRRRRVFVVGCLGDWRSAAAVLFERYSLQGDSAPRREAGKRVAPCLDVRAGRSGETTFHTSGGLVPTPHAEISPSLKARDSKGPSSDGDGDGDGDGAILVPMTARSLRAQAQPSHRADSDTYIVVAHSLRGEGFDASEDGTGRGTPIVPVAIQGTLIGRGETAGPAGPGFDASGISFTLTKTDVHAVAFDTTQITSAANRSNPKFGDPCHPLSAGAHAPAIAFDCLASGMNGFGIGEDISSQLRVGTKGSGCGHQAVAWSIMPKNSGKDYKARSVEVAQPLMAGGPVGGNQGGDLIQTSMQVRRLTPRECERLQGFEDDYTLIPYGRPSKAKLDADFIKYQLRGNPKHLTREDIDRLASDGPRYKALGNSMAVPCMRWIGERIQAVEAISAKAAA